MFNTSNQSHVAEYASTQQNESANMSLTPPPSPSLFPSFAPVENTNTSPHYHYITEEEPSFSPDPYGIALDNDIMLLSLSPSILDVSSSDLSLLTLPTTPLRTNTVHQPSSAAATHPIPPPVVDVDMVTVPSQPSAAVNTVTTNRACTSDVTVTIAAPPPEIGQQNAAPTPSFPRVGSASGDGGSNGTVAPTVGVDYMPMNIFEHGQGSNQNTVEAATVMVKCNEDIIKRLVQFAKKKEMFILSASGIVSFVEFLNQQDAPVAKTTLQGRFEIISLDGNIALPKNNRKNQTSYWLTVLLAGNDARVKGGPVRRLIAGSNVQIVVGTMRPSAIEYLARQQYLGRPELLHFPNYKNRDWLTTEVVNQIHKATLKELNETNTPSADVAPIGHETELGAISEGV